MPSSLPSLMYNRPMQIKKIFSHPGFILFNWFVFVFFLVVVLPAVSYQASQMGLTPSIDTNFSFDPTVIYSILTGYGESGRAFYLLQRWTFDFVWPMVYGFPIFFTLRLWLGKGNASLVKGFIYLPLMAMMLDYLENITFSVIILLYPTEWLILAYLGVLMSLLKWIALGVSLMSVTVLSVVVLFQTILRSIKRR
jgi:hypothetical protein